MKQETTTGRWRMLGSEPVPLGNGLRISCRIEGKDGAPWVVLSNSHGTNLSLWDELTEALAGEFRVLRYDQRGHGGTPPTPPPYAMTDLVADVVGLLDHFQIKRTHVIGVSMGGATALGLALNHPDRLLSAVICDSSVGGPRSSTSDWDDRIVLARREGLGPLAKPTVERWFSKGALEAGIPAVARVAEMVRTTSVDGYIGCANALQSVNFSEGLEAIRLPCMLVCGAEDGPRPKSMQVMHERIPGSQFQLIEKAGHLPNVERPAEFNAVILSFLRGLGEGKGKR